VCVHLYVFVCVYVCASACICAFVHACTRPYACVCMCMTVCACTLPLRATAVLMSTCVCGHVCGHLCAHVHVYMFVHAFVHVSVLVRVQVHLHFACMIACTHTWPFWVTGHALMQPCMRSFIISQYLKCAPNPKDPHGMGIMVMIGNLALRPARQAMWGMPGMRVRSSFGSCGAGTTGTWPQPQQRNSGSGSEPARGCGAHGRDAWGHGEQSLCRTLSLPFLDMQNVA